MESKTKIIVIHEKDNVAVALKPLKAGETIFIEIQGLQERIKLLSDIPMGHKIALVDIEEGAMVIKYGEAIGKASKKINRGAHVHIHNVVSQPRGVLQ